MPDLAATFHKFGREECTPSSPLYARLSELIAADRELLALAAETRYPPAPNLFFGAVQYLAGRPLPPDFAFRDFCFEHRAEIVEMLHTRRVQTNEVRRAAILRPAFELIGGEAAMIEVGCSAGFLSNWDRYAYRYGDTAPVGPPGLLIRCDVRRPPPCSESPLKITARVGIDLDPIAPTDVDALNWLRALIWPELHERRALFEGALATLKANPVPTIKGDALDVLPGLLDQLGGRVVIFHAAATYQFTDDQAARFAEIVRPHYHVSLEKETLHLNGRQIATSGKHGAWIDFSNSETVPGLLR